MNLYHARDSIADELQGDVKAIWVGSDIQTQDEFAMPYAYGEIPLDQAVQDFEKWCDR